MESPLPLNPKPVLNPQEKRRHTQGLIWLMCSLMLLVLFFMPNYSMGSWISLSGVDLLRGMANDFEMLFRVGEDFPSLMMIITPFLYWGLGFITLIISISILSNKKGSSIGALVVVLSTMAFLVSVLTAVLLHSRSGANGFLGKMMPKPGLAYYLAMLMEVSLVVSWFFYRPKGPKEVESVEAETENSEVME